MGEMLQDGGNKWRGMLYGMTGRAGYGVENRPIWNVWDTFGIQNSEMIGYWVSYNPVKTNSQETLATIYRQKGDKTLIALATWAKSDSKVKLSIDWKELGLDPKNVMLHAPAVDGFQEAATWNVGDEITVPQGKGLLILVEKKLH